MGMPDWWRRRRFGIFVHANLATVPAWAPIGEYSDWYRSHLGDDVADVLLHPRPLVEVVAHHRDRWGFVEHFDDFAPLLTFEDFDAAAWAELASAAGAGYTVFVAKHHDGWCWWDAPATDRSFVHAGPKRDVLAEYAAACAERGIVFGAYYSLLDWGDPRYPGADYVEEVLHAHAVDLVERHGAKVLWGDGHWGHGPDHWRTEALLARVRALDPDIVVNDRWWADPAATPPGSPPPFAVYEYDTPNDIVTTPWELCRGIGHSFCHNRAERAQDHLTGFEIVALLTEVVAKGGNLLLNIGPDASGVVPELQAAPLREAGSWIRRFGWLIEDCQPWTTWGDDRTRYLLHRGDLYAIDIARDTARGFGALGLERGRVTAVELVEPAGDGHRATAAAFTQDADGLHVERPRGERTRRPGRQRAAHDLSLDDVAVYHVTLEVREAPAELFSSPPVEPVPLAPLVDHARAGDIVTLGDGRYAGPAHVPNGVVLRGLGPGRTTIDGGGEVAVTLGRNARLEHLSVRDGPPRVAWFPTPLVEVSAPFATVIGCEVDGHVVITGDDGTVRATQVLGIVVAGAQRAVLSRCRLSGMRWDVGIHLLGGDGHEIDSCDLEHHLCAIRATEATGVVVRGNTLQGRWWGVHLERCEDAHVHGNTIHHTMRAIDVDGGADAVVEGNAVFDGDSGCLVQNGAAGTVVSGNHWERCRVGLFRWEAPDVHHHGNHAVDLDETALVIGP